MACPIQCTCGRNLAELHDAFSALYQAHVNRDLKNSKIHPIKQGIVEGEISNIRYIYDFLGLESACCRNKIKNYRDKDSKLYNYMRVHEEYDSKFSGA